MKKVKELDPEVCLPTHGLPFKYDPSWADQAIEGINKMMAGPHGLPDKFNPSWTSEASEWINKMIASPDGGHWDLATTARAPQAEEGRKPRHLTF